MRAEPEAAPPGTAWALVADTRVTACRFDEAQELLADLVERRRGAYVCPANAYSIMLAVDDPGYREIVNGADLVTADGMPVVWAQRLFGHGGAERVHNDDLFLACCARYPGWRHFLVGGREGQPEQVAAEMSRRFPGIQVVGTRPTPVRPLPREESDAIVGEIVQRRPDIVWVGMGTPAQDIWMVESARRAGVPMVGVGSLFDLLSGRTRPAPEWMKRNGLQWLFRLLQEPSRLGGRYARYNTRFAMAVAGQWLARRQGR
ncbi:MAG: WecB/TagA/CpsF family glycosyltransferase [Rhodocyclaceae bacterium]|nr:WecB/TagA/CpsF family glycosyltransferase [Rhodocyclaceae bacterium]